MRDRAAQREIDEGLQELLDTSMTEQAAVPTAGVTESQSILNMNEGIERVRQLLESASEDFVGIVDGVRILKGEKREEVIQSILLEGVDQTVSVAGSHLTILAESDRWGRRQFVYIGSTTVASCIDTECGEEFRVGEKPVLPGEYRFFVTELQRLTDSTGTEYAERKLPKELIEDVQRQRGAIQEEALEKCKNILQQAKGEIVGTVNYGDYYGYRQVLISFTSPMDDTSKAEIFEKLMCEERPLYDDQYVSIAYESGASSRTIHYIGDRIVASSYHNNEDNNSSYRIFDRAVSQEDLQAFITNLEKLDTNTEARELPDELKREYDSYKMQKTLESATKVEAGWKDLDEIYGASYFGDGGAYGALRVYRLSDWREGIRTPLEVETESGNNGFVSGPNRVNVPKDSIVIVRGGDLIGRNGRSRGETYFCEAEGSV